jgi:glucokinase
MGSTTELLVVQPRGGALTADGATDDNVRMPSEAPSTTYVGLDVGGTFLKGARVDEGGRVLERIHEPVVRDDINGLLDQLVRAVSRLDPAGAARAVGIGIPGIVHQASSRVLACPNLPLLDGFSLGMEIAHRTARPAFLENDANAAALGEAWLGAGRGAESLILVTLGTGVGGGIILRGRIWSGVSGYAGEIGHVHVDPAGVPCGCGSRGCLETVAGIAGWRRRAAHLLESRESALAGQVLDPAHIVDAAKAGDAVAIEVVDGVARALGVGIGAVLLLLNLDRVVLGGGVSGAGRFLLDRVVDHTRRRVFCQVLEECGFALAELGGEAGVVGAARVASLALAG